MKIIFTSQPAIKLPDGRRSDLWYVTSNNKDFELNFRVRLVSIELGPKLILTFIPKEDIAELSDNLGELKELKLVEVNIYGKHVFNRYLELSSLDSISESEDHRELIAEYSYKNKDEDKFLKLQSIISKAIASKLTEGRQFIESRNELDPELTIDIEVDSKGKFSVKSNSEYDKAVVLEMIRINDLKIKSENENSK